jgi:hypothetical protein
MSNSANAVSLDSDSSLPSWFKPARFLDVEFDADAYVSDLRRFVSEQLHPQAAMLYMYTTFRCAADPLHLADMLNSGTVGDFELSVTTVSHSAEGQVG